MNHGLFWFLVILIYYLLLTTTTAAAADLLGRLTTADVVDAEKQACGLCYSLAK